MNILKGW